jgi:AraC-like DNA-binding protein
VAANLHASLRIDDLAIVAHLSRGYFKRAFKVSFGETPHGYLMRMRVERAQQMMLEGQEPLAQIAMACGLADQAHLSRVFRQATGSSPGAWRRRHPIWQHDGVE